LRPRDLKGNFKIDEKDTGDKKIRNNSIKFISSKEMVIEAL
jgi:hypothetical protein